MADSSRTCAICLSPIESTVEETTCPTCHALYHSECWSENGGCAVYGCTQVAPTEKRQAIEIPVSYWGQENKNCPNCGKEILAAAVRCRHCGTTFESARPQDTDEFQQRNALSQRLPAARRTVIWLFVFSMITFLAPIGAVWGIIWVPSHRDELRALPAIYGALSKIGLALAITQAVGVVLLTLLFALVRAH